jgi:hypothetical protein
LLFYGRQYFMYWLAHQEKTPATEVTGVFKVLLQAFLPKWQLLVSELRLSDDVSKYQITGSD